MKRIAAIVLFVLSPSPRVAPIRSYDYFWHLATGRWIVEHHAIPRSDPLARGQREVAVDQRRVAVRGRALRARIAGDAARPILNALLVAAIFTARLLLASQRATGRWPLLVAGVAFAGASDRLGVRPSTAAALLIVIAIGALGSRLAVSCPLTIVVRALTIVWINVHPSALLAPLIALSS